MQLIQHNESERDRGARIPRSAFTRKTGVRVATILGAVAAVGALACSDGLTRPQAASSAEDDFRMSGVLVSSLMRADAGVDSPISTVSMRATLGGTPQESEFDAPVRSATDPLDASILRNQAAIAPDAAAGMTGPSFDRGGSHRKSIVRPRGSGRSFRTHRDGKDFELQYVDDPRGGNRPPAAVITLINGRAAALNQYTYTKLGKSWIPTASRATIYDSTGHATLVTSNTFRANVLSEASMTGLGLDVLADGAGKLLTAIGKLAQPDILYAETVADEIDSDCFGKAASASFAEIAWLGAIAAVGAAAAACVTTIIECPALIAAHAALAAADYNFGKAETEYYLCLQKQQQQQQTPPPSGGATNPPPQGNDGGSSCAPITWEISYDDGASWNYLGTTSSC